MGNNADIHRQRASLIHCIHVSPVLSNVDVKWIFFYSNYMHRQIPKAYYKSFLLCGWKWITCIYLLCLFHLLNGTKQLHISCIRRHTAATGHSPIGSFTYGLALIIQKHWWIGDNLKLWIITLALTLCLATFQDQARFMPNHHAAVVSDQP